MSALNSSVVSTATTVGAKLFQWGIVLGGKKNASGHHYKSGSCNTVSCVIFCSLRGVKYLSLSIDIILHVVVYVQM